METKTINRYIGLLKFITQNEFTLADTFRFTVSKSICKVLLKKGYTTISRAEGTTSKRRIYYKWIGEKDANLIVLARAIIEQVAIHKKESVRVKKTAQLSATSTQKSTNRLFFKGNNHLEELFQIGGVSVYRDIEYSVLRAYSDAELKEIGYTERSPVKEITIEEATKMLNAKLGTEFKIKTQ